MTDMRNDPQRAAQLSQQLVRAMRDDAPPHGAEQRALSALRLSAAGQLAEVAHTATQPVHASRWLMLKWLGGAAVLTLLAFSLRPNVPALPAVVSPAAPLAQPKIFTAPNTPTVSSLAIVEPQPSNLMPKPRELNHKVRVQEPKVGLHEELLSLEVIRKTLASGDARASLRLLTIHDRTFAHGRLVPEAALLRVQALGKAGDSRRAAKLAEKLLRDNPRTQYAHELSQWLVQQD